MYLEYRQKMSQMKRFGDSHFTAAREDAVFLMISFAPPNY